MAPGVTCSSFQCPTSAFLKTLTLSQERERGPENSTKKRCFREFAFKTTWSRKTCCGLFLSIIMHGVKEMIVYSAVRDVSVLVAVLLYLLLYFCIGCCTSVLAAVLLYWLLYFCIGCCTSV